MGYVIKFDIPGLAKGAEVQIAGLGTFENGNEYVISDEEHDSFRRYHGTVTDKNELELGATLLQSKIHGVAVEATKKSTKKEGDES